MGSVVDCVFVLQGHLQDLEDPQVALNLLRSCQGVCKLNYLLQTIPLAVWTVELLQLNDSIRRSLSLICNFSISNQS